MVVFIASAISCVHCDRCSFSLCGFISAFCGENEFLSLMFCLFYT